MSRFYSSVLILFLLIGDAVFASSMRCGQNVIQKGATKIEVLKYCNEPDMKELISGLEDVRTEVWYYDRGPAGFLYILTFRGSRLTNIEVRQS